MKKYIQPDMYILALKQQDVITTSPGFLGGEEDNDGFGNPNTEAANPTNFKA